MEQELLTVKEAILESSSKSPETCLAYLRDRLNELGHKFPLDRKGEKEAYKTAARFWWNIREEEYPLDEIEMPDKLEILPGTKIQLDGINCVIHGIPHGEFKPPEPIKEHLQKEFHKYQSPALGIACIMEDGLSSLMGVVPWKNFGDFSVMPTQNSFLKELLYRFKEMNEIGSSQSHVKRFSSVAKTANETWKGIRKDLRYLPRCREVSRRLYLPEPLLMNYMSDKQYATRSMTDRSLYMAQVIREFDLAPAIKELHAIVGTGHEPQIAYFLTR